MIDILEYPIEKNRDEFYDALKSFAIFTMVLGHVLTCFWTGRENDAVKENFIIHSNIGLFMAFVISIIVIMSMLLIRVVETSKVLKYFLLGKNS